MYYARWDRRKDRGGAHGREVSDGLLGTLNFRESKRNIVFHNQGAVSVEEWEEVRERKKKFGSMFLWLKKLTRRYAGV